jgi:hypothetical protein
LRFVISNISQQVEKLANWSIEGSWTQIQPCPRHVVHSVCGGLR